MEKHFICALNGQCEYDPIPSEHHFLTQEECRANCTSSTEKELDYLMYQYSLTPETDIGSIAPSDRIELIKRETGVVVTPEDSYLILGTLADHDGEDESLEALSRYQGLWHYMFDYEGMRDEADDLLLGQGTVEILNWYREAGYDLTYQRWRTYLANSEYDEETKDMLFSDVSNMFSYLIEYHKLEEDTPGLAALSYLLDDPRAKDWYDELMNDYREYRVDVGLEAEDEYFG